MWVLVVVAMMGSTHDGGRSIQVSTELFQTEVACKSAAEFVARDGFMRDYHAHSSAGHYLIDAKCIRDVER